MTQNTTTSPITDTTHSGMPYAKSWIDQFTAWIDRLHAPSWVFYVAATLMLAITSNVLYWIDGSQVVGSFDPIKVADAVWGWFFLGLYHHLSVVIGQSFYIFQSALKLPEAELKTIHYRLTSIPPRLVWLGLFVGIVLSITTIPTDLASFGLDKAQTPLPFIFQYAGLSLVQTFLFALIFQMVRQLRLVITLHQQVVDIDLYQLAPFHAFANFTARAGSGLVVFVIANSIYGFFFNGSGAPLFIVVVVSVLAVAVFVMPLLGMRSRLEVEKERRMGITNEALKVTFDRIHTQVNSDMYEKISGLNNTMTALMEEQKFVKQISTWPWDTSTLRGFTSTLLVPVFIWLVTQLLERLI